MEREVTDSERFHERRAGALHDAVYGTVRAWDGVGRGTVAGCPAFFVDGSPFAVVSDGGLALSGLSEADSERLRVRWSALTFDPSDQAVEDGGVTPEGRSIQSDGGRDRWPLVPVGGNDLVLLRPFLRLSYDGARGLSAGARTAD